MIVSTKKRLRRMVAAACLLGAAGCAAAASTAQQTSEWQWADVSRVVSVGDLHGNHQKLIRLLAAADLIDDEQHWSGGEDHLVVAGDFLDRGLDDRPLMDLLRRLETESITAGGRVHVLLGNHEVMNLLRDLRYVNPASYRDFEPEERKRDRTVAAGKFARMNGFDWNSESFREFNRRFPAGYFARLKSLNPDGEYGSWLMRLPTIVKINGVAYTHGGLNEEFAALGGDGINRRVTGSLERYLDARGVLEAEGAVLPVMTTLEVVKAAEKVAERARGGQLTERQAAAKALLEAAAEPILGVQGPLWYRGNALQDERLERDILDNSLELLGATALVVAHSPTTTSRITSRFHGRLFRIDHGIGDSETPLALVAEQGEILVLDSGTRQTTTPVREFPVGQLGVSGNAELTDKQLAEFLSLSPILAARTLGKGSTRPQLIVLERGGEIRRGIFKTVENDSGTDRYQHEVAAYRLDRALGLGMVPVTVVRTVGGHTGSLQAWVEGALDLETAHGYNLESFETEGKASQLALGRIFDALIGNASRKPADVLTLVQREQILLIDHSKAFSTSPELPSQPAALPPIPAPLAEALEGLNRGALGVRLGQLISTEQIEALLQRRDKIIARREFAVAASP